MELELDGAGVRLAATLDLPVGPVRGGMVVLHGAGAGHRSYFCYEHLARLLPGAGIAVLRFDRRPGVDGHDVPLTDQAADAVAAIDVLRRHAGDVPVGLWGLSQGAWTAPLTAALRPDLVAFLVLVSSSGVSPAAQMRYGTAEQLRLHGYGDADRAELGRLRATVEAYLRGDLDRATAQAAVDRAAERPWFPLVYLPRELPDQPGTWRDMDFDPAPVFARVACPVLFYGTTDAWVPIDASVTAWRRATAAAPPRPPSAGSMAATTIPPSTGARTSTASARSTPPPC
ncbi:Alpha/beta hydrolase family protein [Micromonospora sp. MW-13]|uniref:alpha/beta hydrolase n=1 Tax=Micromonospora sp. MW-13 TaxID=2094022 RepID=UPI000EBC1E2E|nr:alpha/beta hydrolase [Micromonospora sp. MW-13]RGC70386.1 Alpha/beta hydrolase family protein [Micromonospora sp. MW-13]